MSILDQLVAATARRLERDKAQWPPEELRARCDSLDRGASAGAGAFKGALRRPGLSFICEVKKASPSKGLIAADFPYLEIAADYEAAGAACISVLTETEYFLGDDRHLSEIARAVSLPVLRKDFTIDPYQIYQAKLLGARAVLLICAILTPKQLCAWIELAERLGMAALTEVHDRRELETALAAGAQLVGVNNRDLKTFSVDLRNSIRLRALTPPDILFVAESGISRRADVLLLQENGVDAALIGETLMRSPDRRTALRRLRGEISRADAETSSAPL
jgi:indole-3-glycerol phosphate synthase